MLDKEEKLPQLPNSGGAGLVAKLCLILATPWTVACQAPLSMARILGWVATSFSEIFLTQG